MVSEKVLCINTPLAYILFDMITLALNIEKRNDCFSSKGIVDLQLLVILFYGLDKWWVLITQWPASFVHGSETTSMPRREIFTVTST